MKARPVSKASLTPPQSLEGTWVGDENAESMPAAPSPGVPGAFPIHEYVDDNSPGEETGICPTCGDPACDGQCGAGGMHGALGHGLVFTDLYTEVQSHRRTWVQVDYLSMWAKGNFLPPLVTTSPLGTPQSQAGVLPVSATTSILFGNDRVDLNQRNGGRINIGYWLVDGEFLGVEGQYFTLQPQNTLFNHTSIFSDGVIDPDDIILARPFFNVDPNLPDPREDAAIIAFPNFTLADSVGPLDGTISIKTTSNIQSAGGLLRKLIWIDFTAQWRLDLLLGYRFFRVDDSVIIDDASDFLPTSGPLGPVSFSSRDTFSAKNIFNGGEIGLKYQSYHGPLSVELIAKCAFGNNHEKVFIDGFNTVTVDDVTSVGVGGLLAQPTNIGTYRRNVFAVLPEANANLRWDLTPNLRATLGYTFIYTNRVQRSGDAIDRTLNPTQIGGPLVGPAEPSFSYNDTPFWVHGVSGGVEYRW
jgi:hypothetical protein